jgi:hypothetical protein
MSRLYYEKELASSGGFSGQNPADYRFRRRLEVRDENRAKHYLEKVAKLVPSEVIAGYIALAGLVPLVRSSSARPWISALVFLACAVLTPIYMNIQAVPGKPKRNHLMMSTIAFVVWAYAISGATLVPSWHDPAVASILLVLFSLISGAIRLDR